MALIPWLIPGLGPVVLSSIMQTEAWPASSAQFTTPIIIVILTAIAAAGLGYFRHQIIQRLKLPMPTSTKLLRLRWLWVGADKSLNWIGKLILKTNVILEGQHYLGWAILTALIGIVIIILRVTT